MIPINPLAMMIGFLIFIFSQVLLGLLIACVLALLIPRCRRYMLARRWRFGLIVVGLAFASVPYVWSEITDWQDWRAHNPRLERDEVLGDLVLPAGTRVRLDYLEPFNDLSGDPVPYGLQSLKQADFERTPGDILGLSVRRLELWPHHGSATVEAVAVSDLQGWKCEPGEIEFHFPFGAHFKLSEWHLYGCTLAPGSSLGGIVWPGPVKVFSTEGEGWEVRAGDTSISLFGLELRWLSMRLNKPYGDVLGWDGVLNREADVGPVHYPVGTQVRRYHEALLFSPPAETSALDRRTGTPIEADHSVLQRVSGEVLGIRPNSQEGLRSLGNIVTP
ncbi:hypothetical protein SAMN05216593_104161 [Pseudomonas asturiensis]|uniref:Uncharacterized protein n=1 Tax=Pseudomonas asturiensis TaxID=1190415 RepID=A0A1M7MEB8_9PSED|nr:hypothetical protein [Pseudomonas asturiensis]SHM89197.1 hypothetical protein SAMN05216593_104161 [Pseudomonas asturiensis]